MMKIYRNWGILALSLFMLVSMQVSAQNVTVSGAITDDTGQPLPGVSILEKGTANGTTSDVDGNYSISVSSSGSTLVFSFIGFQSQEIALNNQSKINVRWCLM